MLRLCPITLFQLTGGNSDTYSVTFATPVNNLVVSILSLGQSGDPTAFDFTKSFSILSQGTDYWGGNAHALSMVGDSLIGIEGSGSILVLRLDFDADMDASQRRVLVRIHSRHSSPR